MLFQKFTRNSIHSYSPDSSGAGDIGGVIVTVFILKVVMLLSEGKIIKEVAELLIFFSNNAKVMAEVPYSLKLKIFADFVGQSKATKIFSCEIFSSSLILGMAGSSTTSFIHENLFLNRIWLKREIFTLKNFRLYGNAYSSQLQ